MKLQQLLTSWVDPKWVEEAATKSKVMATFTAIITSSYSILLHNFFRPQSTFALRLRSGQLNAEEKFSHSTDGWTDTQAGTKLVVVFVVSVFSTSASGKWSTTRKEKEVFLSTVWKKENSFQVFSWSIFANGVLLWSKLFSKQGRDNSVLETLFWRTKIPKKTEEDFF